MGIKSKSKLVTEHLFHTEKPQKKPALAEGCCKAQNP